MTVLRCADSSYRVDHATAEFSCAQDLPDLPDAALAAASSALHQLVAGSSGLVDGAELYGPISFQSGRFRRIALLPEVTARSGRALARGTDEQPWYPDGSELADTTFLLGSPGLNDAALQVLQACVPHRRVRPAACESVQFSGRSADGPVEIRAVAEPVRAVAAGEPAQSGGACAGGAFELSAARPSRGRGGAAQIRRPQISRADRRRARPARSTGRREDSRDDTDPRDGTRTDEAALTSRDGSADGRAHEPDAPSRSQTRQSTQASGRD